MAKISEILEQHVDFDPSSDFETFTRQIPARWAIYLMTDAEGQPIQLLSVKNLRYSIKRRLGGDETIGLSKRVNYQQIVRRISWRRVDSAFEADWIYHDVAREVFPQTYQGMVGFRPAWFIHVDPDARFPRYLKTIDLSRRPGLFFGPIEDKHAAQKLIESVEDWFDLCRYYQILIEAPNGRACAYKEMGKCPAPCDGSISMPQYRRMIEWSARTIADPKPYIREHTERMQQAAADLHFETAGKIKALLAQVSRLGKGSLRHMRNLNDLAYVSLQGGPRPGFAKVFLIVRGWVEEVAGLLGEPAAPAALLRQILTLAEGRSESAPTDVEAERIGIVSHHLFTAKQIQGIFLPLMDISENALIKGYKDLIKQKRVDESEGEGVIKELQAMDEGAE